MFPSNPHAAAWKEKAIEYMMNTLSAPQDEQDATLVDGQPVRNWFTGANVHPDFTLENHGFFHPGYMGCSSYFLTQTAMYFTFAHQPIPAGRVASSDGHMENVSGNLLPNGEAAYPQGMDWELHGIALRQSVCVARLLSEGSAGGALGGSLFAIHAAMASEGKRRLRGIRFPSRIHPARHTARERLLTGSWPTRFLDRRSRNFQRPRPHPWSKVCGRTIGSRS